MLTKFEVTNFKNFNEKLSFDFTESNNYEFNKECVVNGVINKTLVYGHNASGKSNLGFAIFDLISHLTDKTSGSAAYSNYLNAYNKSPIAEFRYEFLFEEGTVIYEYGKENIETLVYERVYINGNKYASINRNEGPDSSIFAEGAESLNKSLGDSKISIVSYIKKNSVLSKNLDNICFIKFIKFVNGMLFFRSLGQNDYIGFEQGSTVLITDIIEKEHVKDLQAFLNDAGIECKLKVTKEGDQPNLVIDFDGKLLPFYEISSHGTQSLVLFYYWFQRFKGDSKVTFLFIDEFDAFYHHSLSALIIKTLRKIKAQVVLTTHNTSVMTNELLRPDCYFLLNQKGLHSLANSTVKELREAHNIEKMYRSGSFGG